MVIGSTSWKATPPSPADYILFEHFLDEIDDAIEEKLAAYLRRTQGSHGGWPLYHDGDFNMSASVKAYFALKMVGDQEDAVHMRRARETILAHGGAAKANVFTRLTLALFGQVPWRAVPVMRAEILLLPRWFPFHLSKVSYWSRTVIVPLLILFALKPRAANPRGVGIGELFTTPAEAAAEYQVNPTGSGWGEVLIALDRVVRALQPLIPKAIERHAIRKAVAFITERLNGDEGLGAIYPAMANTVMAMRALGYADDDPDRVVAKQAVRKLLVLSEAEGFCQPCRSPVWDTCLAAHAMMEAGEPPDGACVGRAMDWLAAREITQVVGDWATARPGVAPSGWAFQYRNDHYPDVDDSAVVAMAFHRAGEARHRPAIERAARWIEAMQSKNGGWAAFDADNTRTYLNHIPFADHGALLDPPTVDVTARCVSFLAQLGHGRDHPAIARGLAYLLREQEPDGSWFGRWGTNYIYGTWSALCAFNAYGEDREAPHIRRAVAWLEARQRADDGWGEDAATYWEDRRAECKASTPSQTAWALLGLMAAGEVESEVVRKGVGFLLRAPREDGKWRERYYNAVGFPRTFYLLYHGYGAYFPTWALARYRNLLRGSTRAVPHGM